ncbi:MAG: YfhO family protein [Lachnospiraceae bacterium]|nr:YfhO family protein [Lachnospiraceae bacterium]
MDKILKKIQPKYYKFISAALAMFGMYMIMSYCNYLPNDKHIIMDSDMIEQYVPYIKMFLRDLINGESIWFSWNTSLGMNTSLVNAYYVMSPFNLLYLIFWNVDENVISLLIIILKIGFTALSFHIFLNRVVKREGVETILFSLMYSLSTYMVLYGHMYNSWLEGMYMLPLICTFIYELDAKKGSYLKLILAYAYMFVTQFYFAYMVGIFSFVFWLLLQVMRERTTVSNYIRRVLKYAGSVALAIGLSAVILLPAFLFLMYNNAMDATTFEPLAIKPYHFIYTMLWGVRIPFTNDYPALYSGWLILILIPAYFLNKEIGKNEKICSAFLMFFLVLSMFADPLYQFMHAFDAPDHLNFRHVFLFAFVVCTIGCRQISFWQKMSEKQVIITIFAVVILGGLCIWLSKDQSAYLNVRILINLLLPAAWFGLWYLLKRRENDRVVLTFVAVVLVVVELCGNGWFSSYNPLARVRTEYECWKDGITYAVEEMNLDEDFYRSYYNNDMSDNSDSWFGYNGITDFCSAENYYVRQAVRYVGMYNTTRKIAQFGITPPIEMLLGIKYVMNGPLPSIAYGEDNQYEILENPYYLGLGFMVEEDILDYQYDSYVIYDNINSLMSVLTGERIECFVPFNGSIMAECEQADIIPGEDNIVIKYNPEEYGYGMVTYYIPKEDVKYPIYSQFVNDFSIGAPDSPYFYKGDENNVFQFGLLSVQYAKQLVEAEDRYEVNIVMNSTTADSWIYKSAVFYEYHDEEMNRVYDSLKNGRMEVTEYADGYLKGNVTVSEDKNVLFTSIPYDIGWTVKVDGNVVEPKYVLEAAFIALELEPGYHELEFEYEAPGVKGGILVSGVSLGIYVLLVVGSVIMSRRKREENVTAE